MYFKRIPAIKKGIEKELEKGNRDFILYPFGEIGMLTKRVLNDCYGIEEAFIVDNHLAKYNENIKEVSYLGEIDVSNYQVLITSDNESLYEELRAQIKKYVPVEYIVDLFENEIETIYKVDLAPKVNPIVGKYSYGPLCENVLVKSIGNFTSSAFGATCVPNHPMDYITSHPFLFYGEDVYALLGYEMQEVKKRRSYFEGGTHKAKLPKTRKITIGSDVWIGHNVIITNGSNIGNGAIVGAGAVVTKNVPDYAVVAGVPARIIRYRCTEEQIKALNEIAWWDWDDEKIRKNYDDFFLPVDEFIDKHKR